MAKLKASNENKPRLITSFSDQSKFDPLKAVKAPDCGVWMIKEGIHVTYPNFEKGLRVLNHYYDGTALFCQVFIDPTSVVIYIPCYERMCAHIVASIEKEFTARLVPDESLAYISDITGNQVIPLRIEKRF